MTALPPSPFLSNSAESVSQPSTEQAATFSPAPLGVAADLSAASEGRSNESPAAEEMNPPETAWTFDPDADDCIREIFIGARKLDHRFVLDEERFMLDLEEMPLFLRQA